MLEELRAANDKIRSALVRTREALEGRQEFTVDDIRATSETLLSVAPLVSRAGELREGNEALDTAFDEYAKNLRELQANLERVRFMLVGRQAQLGTARDHADRVSRWADTLQKTR